MWCIDPSSITVAGIEWIHVLVIARPVDSLWDIRVLLLVAFMYMYVLLKQPTSVSYV